jgi:hypothetical protein
MWFHLYPTPTCLGIKGLVVDDDVVVVVVVSYPITSLMLFVHLHIVW